jgi:hypothetical protein
VITPSPERRPVVSLGATGHTERWTALLEFSRTQADPLFRVADLESVMAHLEEWHPTGLWDSDRYAIQLEIPAAAPHLALQWALVHLGDAWRAVGGPTGTLMRVEMSTFAELERAWQEYDVPLASPDAAAAPLLWPEAFAATRRLLAATTRDEIAQTLVAFVTSCGGQVTPGAPSGAAGMVDVDISLDGGRADHATAESISVSGLILECALPAVVADARIALARLQRFQFDCTPQQP